MAIIDAMLLVGVVLLGHCCCTKTNQLLDKLLNTKSPSKRSSEPGCDGRPLVVTGYASAYVQSSSVWAGNYPDNRDCQYLIRVDQGKNIQITFNQIDIEYDEHCEFDYLRFYDGESDSDPVLETVCGNPSPLPADFQTTGRNLLIEFHSDMDRTATGFSLEFSSNSLEQGCAGAPYEVTYESAEISSPLDYSGHYPNNRFCQYLLTVPQGHVIHIRFIMLDLEYHEECKYDYLKFYDGSSATSAPMGFYCDMWETPPDDLVSSGRFVLVIFHSDQSGSGFGYQFIYSSVATDSSEKSQSVGNHGSCGTSKYMKRISEGRQAREHQWPWLVHLRIKSELKPNISTCGGALIHPSWVLTAAHCLEEARHRIRNITRVTVQLAEHNIEDDDHIKKSVSKIIFYPGRTGFAPTKPHDLALIKLDSPAPLSAEVNTVCLPSTSGQFRLGQKCMVAGWGRKRFGQTSNVLLDTDLDIISESVCKRRVIGIHKDVICALVEDTSKSTCQGDSGGPLVCLEEGQYYIAGVVAFGPPCGMFNYSTPSVFTRVTSYTDWITKMIKNN